MLIQCTKKVLDRLHIDAKAAAPTEIAVDDFFCWHANIITADRRKVLIFVNNSTRLAVICYRPKPPAYKKMYEYLAAGVRELFSALNVHPEVIEQYLQLAGAAQITTSGTRSQIARMNKVAEDIAWHSPFFREDQELQTGASVELAVFPMRCLLRRTRSRLTRRMPRWRTCSRIRVGRCRRVATGTGWRGMSRARA